MSYGSGSYLGRSAEAGAGITASGPVQVSYVSFSFSVSYTDFTAGHATYELPPELTPAEGELFAVEVYRWEETDPFVGVDLDTVDLSIDGGTITHNARSSPGIGTALTDEGLPFIADPESVFNVFTLDSGSQPVQPSAGTAIATLVCKKHVFA